MGVIRFHVHILGIIRGRVRFFLLLMLSANAFGAGLHRYAQLVVSDSRATPRNRVRVTYLGTNGYQFEFKNHVLLVDPYFSRVDLLSVALGARIQPDSSRIADSMRHVAPKVDGILVTHGHFDHLLDVPIVMSKTHARLSASRTSMDLAKRAGASSGEGGRDHPGRTRFSALRGEQGRQHRRQQAFSADLRPCVPDSGRVARTRRGRFAAAWGRQ